MSRCCGSADSSQHANARCNARSQRHQGRLRPDLLWPVARDHVQRSGLAAQRRSAHAGHHRHAQLRRGLYRQQQKLAEHGGFAHDDTNVMMLLSNPSFQPSTVNSPVQTLQVAPTVLHAPGTRSQPVAVGADGRNAGAAGTPVLVVLNDVASKKTASQNIGTPFSVAYLVMVYLTAAAASTPTTQCPRFASFLWTLTWVRRITSQLPPARPPAWLP